MPCMQDISVTGIRVDGSRKHAVGPSILHLSSLMLGNIHCQGYRERVGVSPSIGAHAMNRLSVVGAGRNFLTISPLVRVMQKQRV